MAEKDLNINVVTFLSLLTGPGMLLPKNFTAHTFALDGISTMYIDLVSFNRNL